MGLITVGDTTLQASDMATLDEGCYVNDNIISFYLSVLTRDLVRDASTLLLAPSVVFLLTFFEDPAGLAPLLDPLQLHTRDAILIPVNDKSDTSHVVGGSHWSLLIYTRRDDCFRHADSCDSLNLDAAARVAGKLSLFLRRPAGASSAPQPVACAQQENGYDCGPYLMHHAECFVRGVALDADADRAASMRGHVRGVIASLIAAQSSSASPAAAAAAGV